MAQGKGNAIGVPATVDIGGTGAQTLTDHGILVGSGTSAITPLAAMTNGQLPIGSTGADPVPATITAGTNMQVVNGAGSITLNMTGSVLAPVNATTDITATPNTEITVNGVALVTITVPDTFPIGQALSIVGASASGWVVQMGTGQVAHEGAIETTAAGTISSTNRYDCVNFVCTTADTEFTVKASSGNPDFE